MKLKNIVISIFVFLFAIAAEGSEGRVFFWKGETWGKFNNPDNWDVGAQGNGNPDNRIPGEDDTFDFAENAYMDLDGKTFTVKRRVCIASRGKVKKSSHRS